MCACTSPPDSIHSSRERLRMEPLLAALVVNKEMLHHQAMLLPCLVAG